MHTVHRSDGISYAVRQSAGSVGWCALTIKAGTRDEDGFHRGIAHFTEHTIFKGTSTRSSGSINSCLERLGGELNAFTTKEDIVLNATVLKEDLGKAISLLLELAFDSRFPAEEVEIEKGVVVDEIESYKDSPSDDIYDVFEEKLFNGHPLSSSILGEAASVQAITPEELHSFREKWFTPERMTLTVVSPFSEKKMLSMVRRHIDAWESRGEGKDAEAAASTAITSKTISRVAAGKFDICEDKDNHEANCIMGNFAPDMFRREDRLACLLLCNMLGGPACNSILGSTLREKHGWVYNVECSYTPYSDNGIAVIQFGCERQNLAKCRKAIIRTLKRLMQKPFSERRLNAAKRQILGQNAISMENGEAQCISMGKALSCHGEIISDEMVVEQVKAISAERVHSILCTVFDPEKMSTLTYL